MGTNIKILLNNRRKKSDGTYPIILKITHNRRLAEIPLNYSVKEEDWDDDSKEIKKTCKDVVNITRVNNYIHKKKVETVDVINRLIDSREINMLSISEIKDKIQEKRVLKITFCEYTKKIINELESANKLGNAQAYKQTEKFVLKNNNDKDPNFEEINYKWLKRVELQHLAKGHGYNGLSVYFRTIRAVFNRAIKENVIKQELYPFKTYSIKHEKTKKRAINKEDIEKIKELKLKTRSAMWHTKNYFLFSFYLRGMNFIDIAFLKLSNIVCGRIEYTRKKTNQFFSIKITEQAKKILSYYTANKGPNDFIFPIIKRDTPELQRKDYISQRRFYNRKLEDIGKQCGIEAHLSSYVIRHSWGTIAKKEFKVPISIISEGYGHQNEKTTEVYLAEFEHEVIDNVNELITG